MRYYDSCVLTDPPTLIFIKHNADEKPEDCMYNFHIYTVHLDIIKVFLTI